MSLQSLAFEIGTEEILPLIYLTRLSSSKLLHHVC